MCNRNGYCEISDIIAGIKVYSHAPGIEFAVRDSNSFRSVRKIISMSLGVEASQALDDAVNAAARSGVAVVCSAGNGYGRDSCDESPRRAEMSFAVASTTIVRIQNQQYSERSNLWVFKCWQVCVNLCAGIPDWFVLSI